MARSGSGEMSLAGRVDCEAVPERVISQLFD